MSAGMETGEAGFLAGLRRCGLDPAVRNGVAVFTVEPVGGAAAGTIVESGVAVEELFAWPATPPHWVHFPAAIRFASTNAADSEISGWRKHSRDIRGWGNASEPAQAWVAHVRAVLEEAIT